MPRLNDAELDALMQALKEEPTSATEAETLRLARLLADVLNGEAVVDGTGQLEGLLAERLRRRDR